MWCVRVRVRVCVRVCVRACVRACVCANIELVDLHAAYSNITLCPVFRIFSSPSTASLGVNPGYEPASAELPRRSSIPSAPHCHTPPIPPLHPRHHSKYDISDE